MGTGVLSVISTLAFLHFLREILFRKPVIEVAPDGIRLIRGSKEVSVIRQRDIAHFSVLISSVHVGSNNTSIPNYMLSAEQSDGKSFPLCITDRKEALYALKADMERMLNIVSLPT
jgi:hypothetical protein